MKSIRSSISGLDFIPKKILHFLDSDKKSKIVYGPKDKDNKFRVFDLRHVGEIGVTIVDDFLSNPKSNEIYIGLDTIINLKKTSSSIRRDIWDEVIYNPIIDDFEVLAGAKIMNIKRVPIVTSYMLSDNMEFIVEPFNNECRGTLINNSNKLNFVLSKYDTKFYLIAEAEKLVPDKVHIITFDNGISFKTFNFSSIKKADKNSKERDNLINLINTTKESKQILTQDDVTNVVKKIQKSYPI